MASLQIPTVTIEDLQAFQKEHFPGEIQHTPTFQDTHDETEFPEDGDEDLGYYPDGVKRTLTDEQIRIFRHSEIHSLLREREIQAENETFDESGSAEDDGRGVGDGLENDGVDKKAGVSQLTSSKVSALKRESITTQANIDSTAGSLDYGEDGLDQSDNQPKTVASSSFTGRKIISYAD